MAALTSQLDLSRLLLTHSTISTIAALSYSPFYNLPISLYGLFVTDYSINANPSPNTGNSGSGRSPGTANIGGGGAGGDGVRSFAGLWAISFVLDILWLIIWRNERSGFFTFLVVINMVLKPITLLAALGNLRARGQSTFNAPGGIGGFGGGLPSMNVPGIGQIGGAGTFGGQGWGGPHRSTPYQAFNDSNDDLSEAEAQPGAAAAPHSNSHHHATAAGGFIRPPATPAKQAPPPPPPQPNMAQAQQQAPAVGGGQQQGGGGGQTGGYHTLE